MFLLFLIVDLMIIPFSPLVFFMLLLPIIVILVYLVEQHSRSSTRVEKSSHSIPGTETGGRRVSRERKPSELGDASSQINNLLTRIDELESTLISLKAEVLERDKIITELKNKLESSSRMGLEDDRQADLETYRELLAALELKYSSGKISSEEYYSLKSKFEDKIRRLSI